ncbi:MAG: phosphoenolpyruvate--protein phosphotransferase [Actinomycetaceae bacterium]|nr:phosphoenolpyruvate--protein phosphotransferase [Actinomycetaceae bacterium]
MNDFPHSSVLWGTPVVPGVAIGTVAWVHRVTVPPTHAPDLPEGERAAHVEAFKAAADAVRDSLFERAQGLKGSAREVVDMTAAVAADPALSAKVETLITGGIPAVQAVMAAADVFIDQFIAAGTVMAERAADVADVRDRIVARLLGQPEPGLPHMDSPVILMADDLAPVDTATLNPDMVKALVTVGGGPTSHTAIIARQLGIPCVVAAHLARQIPNGVKVLVDGTVGRIQQDPDPEQTQELLAQDAQRRERVAAWRGPATLADGRPVRLLANSQTAAGVAMALSKGAEGIGLFRTELVFLNSVTEPSIEEQVRAYQPAFDTFPDGYVVIRTLDAGSDKPITFANLRGEDNPALGVRGIRISGPHPDLLLHQLDAIALAGEKIISEGGQVRVMAPMVATLPEARWFADLARERGLSPGIMVEVPSVALMADRFFEAVDFVSIGTNDLTQYTMAADRLSPHLATYSDPWQPAVLTLVDMVCAAGRAAAPGGKPVGVCGEAAADPALAAVLLGMGVTSLSMAPMALATVGAELAELSFEQCLAAAKAVRVANDPTDARNRAYEALGFTRQ